MKRPDNNRPGKRTQPPADARQDFLSSVLSRRDALKIAGGLVGVAFAEKARGRARYPNIIFILSDNQRWDFMGCAGHPFVRTPNMDRLAEEGIIFSNAFVTTSLCSPSRASLLTGCYAHTHGVRDNITPWDNRNVTFLEILKRAGYDTAFIGKWHMPGDLPVLRGVDLFVTFTIQGGQGRYFDCPLVVNGEPQESVRPYITEELTDRALDFISAKREKPFCVFLSHKAVHHPWQPPQAMADLYKSDKPPFPREYNPFVFVTGGSIFEGIIGPPDELYRDYARVVTSLDLEIGRILERIDRLGIAGNTIVVFASDNGFFWGEHQLGGTGRWPYEESIRVPFVVRAPGIIKDPGRRAEQMVLNIDLAPSLLEMAGLEPGEAMEGRSFLPVLESASAQGREAWLYEYFKDFPFRVPSSCALRTERHMYIEFEGRRGNELYDVLNDPRQLNNMIVTAEGSLVAKDLKERLEGFKKGRQG